MKKFAKKVGIGFAIVLFLLVLTSVVIAGFFEDQISAKLLNEINKQIESELTVDQFHLNLLSGFPNASADLRNIVLEDSRGGTLLEAEKLSFRFGLFSLFGSNIKVRSVVVSNGALFINIDKKGKANYDIVVKGENEEESESDFSLSLEEASFDDVELIYIDERTNQTANIIINEAQSSGEFSSEQFSLNSFANMKSVFVETESGRFLPGTDIVYNANIDVDLAKGSYLFSDVDLAVASNIFKVNGRINQDGKTTIYDLRLNSEEGNIESIINLLPEEYQSYLGDFESEGNFSCDAFYSGRLNEKERPALKVDFGLTDGKISSPRLKNALKEVTFDAHFTNGKNGSNKDAIFEIGNLKGYFNRELIQSKLRITNLDDPRIELGVDGVVPCKAIYGLLNSPSITSGDGEIEFKNLKLKGKYKDMKNPERIRYVETSGTIEFDDAEFEINKEEIIIDRGKIKLIDNSLLVSDIKLEGAGSEIKVNGKFLNLLPVIFADSLNTNNAELSFQASIDASEMDFDRLYALTDISVKKGEVTEEVFDSLKVEKTHQKERFTNLLKGVLQAKIDQFNYNKIKGENFSGSCEFKKGEVDLKGNMSAMGGKYSLDGNGTFKGHPHIETNITMHKIDVKELFRQAENFGQEVLEDKHVKGDLDAYLNILTYWDEDGTFLYDKLEVYGKAELREGELENMKLLYDFSSYIKMQDLKKIKFVNLEHWFKIKNSKFILPAMFLQSNALNMDISGKHTFENEIDYNVKINAGQVIWNKFKKHNPKYEPNKAKKKGWFNLYYNINGTVEDFEVESDKKGVKRDLELSEHTKRVIKKKLVAAFGSSIVVKKFVEPMEHKIPEYEEEEDLDNSEDFIEGFEEMIKEEIEEEEPQAMKDGDKKATKTDKATMIKEYDEDEEDEFIDF